MVLRGNQGKCMQLLELFQLSVLVEVLVLSVLQLYMWF